MNTYLPLDFNNYHEPFVGGGSVFIYLKSLGIIKNNVLLSDQNENLINVYKSIQADPNSLIDFIDNLQAEDFTNMSRQWGSSGVSKVRREFQRIVHQKHESFQPVGLLQYIKESSGVFNEETRENIFEVQESIKDFIFSQLKQEFGSDSDKWWRLGVPKQIQKDCAVKSIEVDPPEPPENFLLVLDYQKIVKTNWKLFGDTFTPPKKKQGNKDAKMSWFVRFNSIRNRVMHPERQDITEEEYLFIKDIKVWLLERIVLIEVDE